MTSAEAHHVFYVSRCVSSPEMLEQLLAHARERNARVGLSGALWFTGGHFAQWLEGPRPVLSQTLQSISTDPRHDNMRCLLEGPLSERRFGQWTMALLPATGADDLMQQWLREPVVEPQRILRFIERQGAPSS